MHGSMVYNFAMDHRDNVMRVFERAVDSVDPYRLVKDSMLLRDKRLIIRSAEDVTETDLSGYSRVFLVAAGKAACPMAVAAKEVLGDWLTEAVIVTKYGHTMPLDGMLLIEAGHPVPDDNSLRAAKAVMSLALQANKDDFFVFLISGGASSLLTLPFSAGGVEAKLGDIRKTTELLLSCGAEIEEINCIRKHLSGIKGGRLAEAVYPAAFVSLILSDVIGDPVSSIASGPTVFDDTSYADAMRIAKKYNIFDRLPESVCRIITDGSEGRIPETPDEGAVCFKKGKNVIIGNNYRALLEAKRAAGELGYDTVILTDSLTGEASQLGVFFSSVAASFNKDRVFKRPVCLIAGGESTVTIRGHGKGGRNQEMALSFALSAVRKGVARDFAFLSGATDGNDGPTDAAGGFITRDCLDIVAKDYKRLESFLADNNSYPALKDIGALLVTGPTNTNVCDIQLLMMDA